MAQVIVRKLDDAVVARLKQRARAKVSVSSRISAKS